MVNNIFAFGFVYVQKNSENSLSIFQGHGLVFYMSTVKQYHSDNWFISIVLLYWKNMFSCWEINNIPMRFYKRFLFS